MRNRITVLIIFLMLGSLACDAGPKSGRGFRLPDGDIERGKIAFAELKCNACHTVEGVVMPIPAEVPQTMVKLGGEVYSTITYGKLVTSIINPSHEFARGYSSDQIQSGGKSRMPDYGEVMTVRQMTDVVAFLQSHYKVVPPEPVY